MGIKPLHLGKIIQIFEEELRLVGQLVGREGTTVHEPLDDTRAETSHQSAELLQLTPKP
jgi:hypothetical protein